MQSWMRMTEWIRDLFVNEYSLIDEGMFINDLNFLTEYIPMRKSTDFYSKNILVLQIVFYEKQSEIKW